MAFPGGAGTLNMKQQAKKAGIKVKEMNEECDKASDKKHVWNTQKLEPYEFKNSAGKWCTINPGGDWIVCKLCGFQKFKKATDE